MMIRPSVVAPLVTVLALACGCSEQRNGGPDTVPDLQPIALQTAAAAPAKGSWPLFGGSPARNMANTIDKNIPSEWSIEDKKNIKWVATLGDKAYGGPVIAGGKVFMGTNNRVPRDPKIKGHKSVVMCFQESDGKFLWQAAHDIPPDEALKEVISLGLLSTPAIDGNRIYYVLPQSVVVCTDADTGKTLWTFDMHKELKVSPFHCSNCSPLVVGKNVFVVTGNGVDEQGKLANPEAASFLALDKETGKVAWKSNLPGERVIDGQWSNPAYAVVSGKPQVIFPGGDATLYSLEPDTGKLIWKFHCHPKRKKPADDRMTDNSIISTPVIHDNKIYVGLGQYPDIPTPSRSSYFLCVDATKSGDVSPGTSLDPKAADNKDSTLVWAYGGAIEPRPKKGRSTIFGKTLSTASVHDGLVYIAEETGFVHCLDAKTGAKHWDYDVKTSVWGSTYYVDGRVFIGTEDGEVVVLEASKKLKLIGKVDMGETIQSTPIAVSDVLYVSTKNKLYAIAEKK